ncbi:MAG: sialate O-acetylesterase [Ruminococcus sp.]|nr:sialate O-acetylesterase [Ruminococcus sp.]
MKAAAVFSDNMVLQRWENVRIFGTCDNDEAIRVTIPELEIDVSAAVANCRWETVIPPMNTCSECTVIISSQEGKIIFSNVAVGEVWLAGGQSNMEFKLLNALGFKNAATNCHFLKTRFYNVPKCEMADEHLLDAESKSCWQLPTEESMKGWSAVAFYFARALSLRLGVTVGIINCNWGGTSASAWMDRSYLEADSRLRTYLDDYDSACAGKTRQEMIAEYDEYTAYHAEWEKRMQRCYSENPTIKWNEVLEICGENRYPGPMGCKNFNRPCGLYETMIKRVCPYTIKGFIYYQGESDDHRPDSYYYLMRGLIENWRRDWRNSELPFLFVQLPMFKYEDDPDTKSWAKLREAQMQIFKTVKNTGIAIALDCGEFNNIHPTEKSRIGYRLYLQALCHAYGHHCEDKAYPPMFRKCRPLGEGLELDFDDCDGFHVRDQLSGFEIAGADGEFKPAEVEIREDKIFVSSTCVKLPRRVRYLWTNYSEVPLYGKNGIPVPPFVVEV